MVYSSYIKQRILQYTSNGQKPKAIVIHLQTEGINVSRSGVDYFLKGYRERGTIGRKHAG
jgi:hypothetical protein